MAYIDPHINLYIDKKMSGINPALLAMRSEAVAAHIPIIGNDVARFLICQLAIVKPAKILEIGTAIGYSGSIMLMYSAAQLTTIERNPAHCQRAAQHFSDCGLTNRVRLLQGDASAQLRQLQRDAATFDFIFIDAAKGQYLDYFKLAAALVKKGGMIVADNVLYKGYVAGLPYPRRQRTIHQRLNAFIDYVEARREFTSSILTIGDGVMISVREESEDE